MNDLELVRGAKQRDQKAIELLYKKFTPLIWKHARRSGDEDFLQDAYFTMLKAVDYVDFDKIPVQFLDGRWGFIRTFEQYLMNQVRSSIKKSIKKQNNEFSSYHSVANELGLPVDSDAPSNRPQHDMDDNILFQYSPERMVFSTPVEDKYTSFKKSLTNLEKELLAFRQEGKTLSEIATNWKMPLGKVKNMLVNLKRRASHYFEVVYQYS
jgi:DNA-directed RNA polymerase specialized sigma24 family protein